MSDYAQLIYFLPKDSLVAGDPNKIIRGSDIDPELAAISTAMASKYDVTDLNVDLQGYSASLEALGDVSLTADTIPYATGTLTYDSTPLTPYARTLLDDTDAASARATLEIVAVDGVTAEHEAAIDANTAKRSYPSADQNKLTTIAEGAQVNVAQRINDYVQASVTGSELLLTRASGSITTVALPSGGGAALSAPALLQQLLGVDGTGSLLDADLLGGIANANFITVEPLLTTGVDIFVTPQNVNKLYSYHEDTFAAAAGLPIASGAAIITPAHGGCIFNIVCAQPIINSIIIPAVVQWAFNASGIYRRVRYANQPWAAIRFVKISGGTNVAQRTNDYTAAGIAGNILTLTRANGGRTTLALPAATTTAALTAPTLVDLIDTFTDTEVASVKTQLEVPDAYVLPLLGRYPITRPVLTGTLLYSTGGGTSPYRRVAVSRVVELGNPSNKAVLDLIGADSAGKATYNGSPINVAQRINDYVQASVSGNELLLTRASGSITTVALPSSGGGGGSDTAAQILTKLKTVDVNGSSGINAGTFGGRVAGSFLQRLGRLSVNTSTSNDVTFHYSDSSLLPALGLPRSDGLILSLTGGSHITSQMRRHQWASPEVGGLYVRVLPATGGSSVFTRVDDPNATTFGGLPIERFVQDQITTAINVRVGGSILYDYLAGSTATSAGLPNSAGCAIFIHTPQGPCSQLAYPVGGGTYSRSGATASELYGKLFTRDDQGAATGAVILARLKTLEGYTEYTAADKAKVDGGLVFTLPLEANLNSVTRTGGFSYIAGTTNAPTTTAYGEGFNLISASGSAKQNVSNDLTHDEYSRSKGPASTSLWSPWARQITHLEYFKSPNIPLTAVNIEIKTAHGLGVIPSKFHWLLRNEEEELSAVTIVVTDWRTATEGVRVQADDTYVYIKFGTAGYRLDSDLTLNTANLSQWVAYAVAWK